MKCVKCGKDLEDGWKKCPYCGTSIGENDNSTTQEKHSDSEKIQEKQPGVEEEKKSKKWIFVVILIIVLCKVFYSCSDSGSDNTKQAEVNEDLSALPVLSYQYLQEFADANGIDIYGTDVMDDVDKLLEKGGDLQYVKVHGKSFFSPEYYSITNEMSDMVYLGKTKNNRPDGFGVLFETIVTTVDYMDGSYALANSNAGDQKIYKKVYAGNFNKGVYDGKGVLYWSQEEIRDQFLGRKIPFPETAYNIYQDNVQELVAYVGTPIEYIGEFKDGVSSGKGTQVQYLMDDDGEIVINELYVGNYKDGQKNGKAKEYMFGYLIYDGEYKKDEYNGSGKEYYLSGQIKYKGEYKNGDYNGKGTLYDQDGSVIYKGKWKNGDYAD